MLSVITLNVSLDLIYCYAECHYAVCCFAECRYAECRGAYIRTKVVQNKSSFFSEDQFTKHANITTIYNQYTQKLFTKDIKNAKQQCLGLVDQESGCKRWWTTKV
jgi:hypothetical protein